MAADLITALRANRPLPAEVCVVPRMHEMAAIPAGIRDDVWRIPLRSTHLVELPQLLNVMRGRCRSPGRPERPNFTFLKS